MILLSNKFNSLDNLTELSERSTFHTVKNACEWSVERCVPNFILIFVEYVIWNLLQFLKLKLSLLWIFIVFDEKKYLTQYFAWKTIDFSIEVSLGCWYDYTWLLSFYFVQLSSLQAEILNVKEKIFPIFMVFQLALIPLL